MIVAKFKITKSVTLDQEAIPQAIRSSLSEVGALVEKEVRQRTPQGVGGTQSGLRASIFAEQRESPGLFSEVIGSNLAYAEPVEFGTRPHFPPPAALIPWVEKFLSLREGQTAEGVAYLVARAISRRGTKGAHMFEAGLKTAKPRLTGIFERMGLRVATTLIKPKPGGTP